ncbi:ABC transporter substrate-binding protein [Deinococcus yavapaiensis]|uniref:NitT/TauT family transport system substrate-binding protein n=1 Tax=Deinococcus yavapaiensis KR-236 TaxID=694435 RepID=A0A318SAI4_9DEIO|nr:ABC transporter substrate-binding protein [Deinococcus yavapaiensis]PYE54180.1 NitT/TauT family transport system substrate-binding protein [Deinococcus yavapaiensis KR-236]
MVDKNLVGSAILAALLAGSAGAQSRTITIGLGYIPNVQFAPFYTAEQQGYFKREGLNVKFQHGYVSELMPLLLQGKLDFVVGDPEDAILARVQGAPVKYVMAVYQKLPATLFSLPGEGIDAANDLRGKTIGIPGAFGSSYFALQAFLKANKLSERDVRLAPIGFTQLEAVRAKRVDAAVGFVNNEVVQLRASGIRPNTLDLTKAYPMVGAGLITTEKVLADAVAKKVVRAAQRGVTFTISNPQRAFEIATSAAYAGPNGGTLDVLKASVALMRGGAFVGAIDARNWGTAVGFLQTSGQVPKRFKPSDFYSGAYLDKSVK